MPNYEDESPVPIIGTDEEIEEERKRNQEIRERMLDIFPKAVFTPARMIVFVADKA